MADGSFSGAFKTATTRRQRGFLSSIYGSPCVYQHHSGKWIVMRSMWEWTYALFLDSQAIKWDYENIQLIDSIQKCHIPDFTIYSQHLSSAIEFHEVKPSKFLDRLNSEYLSEFPIKVITENNFNFNANRTIAGKYKIDEKNHTSKKTK